MANGRTQREKVSAPRVKESLRRQIGDASRTLRAPALDDEGVHRARKALKRARANLRLLRPLVGERAYARENAALRDAARPLGAIRDARVIVETLEGILEREKNASRRALLVKLRALLDEARTSAWAEIQASGTPAKSAAALDKAWRRVERRRVPRKGASRLGEGLERIYRRGRSALADVRADCTPETLHEWRKHVKYLGHALDSLGGDARRRPAKIVKRLERLADALGDDHDLVVLEHEVLRRHARSNARAGLITAIAARRKALQSKALKAGRVLFKPKPRAFARGVQAAFREAHRESRKETVTRAHQASG